MPRLFLFMHGLASKKQTVKMVLIGLPELEMILVKMQMILVKMNAREWFQKPIKSQLWRSVQLCGLSCSKILSDIASGFQLF